MNLNLVILVGRVCQTPELKKLPSGTSVVNFSLAINKYWTDKNTGEKKEECEFANVVAFGRTADNVGQWVKKGQVLFVEGEMKTRSWEKDGVKQYRTEINANKVQFGPHAGDAGEKRTGAQKAAGVPAGAPDDMEAQYQSDEAAVGGYEDVPF